MVGQPLHAADHRRGQRGQQERRAEHGAEREPDDAGAEEHREERQERGDRPHDGVHPPHRDADERGAVDVVGAGAHRQAERVRRKTASPRNTSGIDDERDDVVAAEAQRLDGERHVDRRGEALRREVDAEPPGEQQPDPGQHLREADRRHREHEARRSEEAPDHEHLDEHAEHDRGREPGDERDQPAGAAGDDEQHRERSRRRAEVALREVEDPVRAVHEREAEREQRAQPAEQTRPARRCPPVGPTAPARRRGTPPRPRPR